MLFKSSNYSSSSPIHEPPWTRAKHLLVRGALLSIFTLRPCWASQAKRRISQNSHHVLDGFRWAETEFQARRVSNSTGLSSDYSTFWSKIPCPLFHKDRSEPATIRISVTWIESKQVFDTFQIIKFSFEAVLVVAHFQWSRYGYIVDLVNQKY